MQVLIKRVYEQWSEEDGVRILVDRLWPRGVSKQEARLDFWCKEIAPGNELRTWFDHDPEKWEEFKKRYAAELAANAQAVHNFRAAADHPKVTLVYAAKDVTHSHARLLRELLLRKNGYTGHPHFFQQ